MSTKTLSKTIHRLHKAKVCPTGFVATFAVVFVLIYQLREFSLSAFTNRIELRCQLKYHIMQFGALRAEMYISKAQICIYKSAG